MISGKEDELRLLKLGMKSRGQAGWLEATVDVSNLGRTVAHGGGMERVL